MHSIRSLSRLATTYAITRKTTVLTQTTRTLHNKFYNTPQYRSYHMALKSDGPSKEIPPPICRAAVYQGQSVVYDLQANLRTVEKVVKQAAEHKCELLLFPEMFLHGYELSGKHKDENVKLARQTAITQHDDVLKRVSQMCKDNKMSICIGYIEKHEDKMYNAAIMYNTDGEMLVNYRKVHLWSEDEIDLFDTDDIYPVVEVSLKDNKSIKVGINICYDLEFPESSRICALQRAQVLFVPTALTMSDWQTPVFILRARAAENHMHVLYSNHVYKTKDITKQAESETDFMGMSAIIGPEGAEIARARCSETAEHDKPEYQMKFDKLAQEYGKVEILEQDKYSTILMSDINTEVYQGMFKSIDFLRDRRPETFKEICEVKRNLDDTDHQHAAHKTKSQKSA